MIEQSPRRQLAHHDRSIDDLVLPKLHRGARYSTSSSLPSIAAAKNCCSATDLLSFPNSRLIASYPSSKELLETRAFGDHFPRVQRRFLRLAQSDRFPQSIRSNDSGFGDAPKRDSRILPPD